MKENGDAIYFVSFQFEEVGIVRVTNRVRIDETIKLELVEGKWVATNPDGHPSWRGEHSYKNGAVLDYLKRRLGIYPEEEE